MTSILPLLAAILCIRTLLKSNTDISAKILFCSMLVMSLSQAIGLFLIPYSLKAAIFFADSFLIAMYFFFTALVVFTYRITVKSHYIFFLFIIPSLLTCLHITGLMVESYRLEQNSLMHDAGQFASFFDLLLILSLFTCLSISVINYKKSDDRTIMSKNILTKYCIMPVIVYLGTFVMLSTTQYAVSATFFIPPLLVYIVSTYSYLARPTIIDCSSGIGHLYKRYKAVAPFVFVNSSKDEIEAIKREMQKQRIEELLIKHKGVIQLVADDMNMHRKSIENKIVEYNLKDTIALVRI